MCLSLLSRIGAVQPGPFSPSVMFVPQKPYLTLDTLAAQVVFPGRVWSRTHLENHLVDLLNRVGLKYISETYDLFTVVAPWSQILSVGEQQRLSIARLLYHCPKVGCRARSCVRALGPTVVKNG